MSDVFISYVHEDIRVVEYLCKVLTANGVNVWRDKEQLEPGVRWKIAIEAAIRRRMYFVSIYSKARQLRGVSYANEELVVAIEEIRKRPLSRAWFIPVKLDDCEIEARPIGGGETILDLQVCDLTQWASGIHALLKSLGVENPQVEQRKPLGKGLPPVLEVASGFIRYDYVAGAAEVFQGMEHRVVGGWCRRMDNDTVLAYFELNAPIKQFQDFNRLLGYSGFHTVCLDTEVSIDPSAPSTFVFKRDFIAKRGTPVPSLTAAGMTALPFDLPFKSSFSASGYFDSTHFIGKFDAAIEMNQGGHKTLLPSNGIFEIEMREPKALTLI